MNEQEQALLNSIPKKYKQHITTVKIEKSGKYNNSGRELLNYTLFYDNGDVKVFQNKDLMFWKLRQYTYKGYLRD